MRTTCTAEQIEDELGELKLRIAKMNARRNAQINLLQRNILEGSLRNKVYSKPNDLLRRNYLRYPTYYHYPSLYPWKYSSLDDLLNPYYDLDDITKKSVSFLSEKDIPMAYKTLERRAQSNVIAKLKKFVQEQEKEITNEFVDKLVYPRKTYSPKLNYDKNDNIKNNLDTKLYANDRESPFLKPINKSDNFYKRYNSFMKRIMKPFRKPLPLSKSNDYKKPSSIATSQSTNWKYNRPLPLTSKYFPSKINKPLSPIKSSLDDLDASYLRPWNRYSPIYRNYLSDYEYIPKSYRVPKDVGAIIRDMEFENRRTYPFISPYPTTISGRYNDLSTSLKYDPYESDSYIKSNLPTWKQYYYTQKLKSKPSHERLVDYYDPYRDFFCDAASIKSDDLSLSPNKEDSDINSYYDDGCSFPELTRSDENLDDLQIIDSYRDLIYDDIIKNLRSQQARSHLKNKLNGGRKIRTPTHLYNPNVLRKDRSLYNYRITEPNLSSNYSWSKKPTPYNYTYNKLGTSNLTAPYESKYNLPKTDVNKDVTSTEEKPKEEKVHAEYSTSQPTTDENKFDSSKYDYLADDKFIPTKPEDKPTNMSSIESKYSPKKYVANESPIAPASSDLTYQKNKDTSPLPVSSDFTYQKYKDMSPTRDYKTERPIHDIQNYSYISPSKDENIPNNEVNTFSIPSKVAKLDSPTKDNYSTNVFEKESSPISNTRRSSILDKQYSDQPSPMKPPISSNQGSPKKQPHVSNPPSPARQFSESSPPAPISMSRKNSVQYPARRGSIQTGSIEEEPSTFPNTERARKYSRDYTPHTSELSPNKNTNVNQNAEKRLSYGGSIKESFDEEKENKMDKEKYNAYPQYKDTENIAQPKDYRSYNEDQQQLESPGYSRPNQFQQYQSFDNSNSPYIPDSSNTKYDEKSTLNEPPYSNNYNRNPDPPTAQNYQSERYYGDQYDPGGNTVYKSYPEEYNQDQYNYPDTSYNPPYDPKPRDSNIQYAENRAPYAEIPYTNKEKRSSNEAYYTDPRPNDYEKYPDEDYNADYYRSNRNAETRSSNYQNERYREAPDENYNDDYRYRSQPYRDLPKTSSQESYGPDAEQYPSNDIPPARTSFENYTQNPTNEKTSLDQNYPYSGQNSYENPDYPTSENYVDPSTEKISDPITENVTESKPVVSNDSKVKDRKKSLASDPPRETDTPVEPSPKDVPSSRRTSRAALTLAEQKRASTEKMTLAEKNKALKAKPAESKFKRQPSIMKAKPGLKKT